VHAADLFCDLDLQAIATTAVPVAHGDDDAATGYPWRLIAAAEGFPASAAWCYTGAIENHPDLIDAIARARPLAGNPSDVVRRLRDPVQLAAVACAAGLSFPETLTSPDGVPLDGTFLVKPLAGAGGRGIRRWTQAVADDTMHHATTASRLQIWQRHAAGIPLSASYCFAEGSARLLGVSRQLIGEPWCHAGMFAWCGAVALHAASGRTGTDPLITSLERLGSVLAERSRPVGLVGVDLVGGHMAACGWAPPSDIAIEQPLPRPASNWAKAVLFASQPTPVSQPMIDRLTREAIPWTQTDGGWPALADIPRPGQTLAAGAPVVTIFAAAPTTDDALNRLRDRVARIDAVLSGIRRHA
jgi:predicted ATP-grasp superfamily ATP-dependent carboligase